MKILAFLSLLVDLAVGALVYECSIWRKGPEGLCGLQISGLFSTVWVLLKVIDPERYSSLNKLSAIWSRVIRFITNSKSGEKDGKLDSLTTQELSTAMTLWIMAVQGQAFSREIQQISKKDSKLSLPFVSQLRLYLDDNAVLRCRGRSESRLLDEQTKFPVLLPRNEHSTKFVVAAAQATQTEVLGTSWTSVPQKPRTQICNL